MPVLMKAPAKLTLSLRVHPLRPDGFHEIDAEMVTVDLCDELTVTEASTTSIELVGAGPDVPANDQNLVVQALEYAGRTAHVRLVKNIPSQAGLGGGSADAAAILRWAGKTDPVEVMAIGSDIAFCLHGGRARVTGAGERIEPLDHVDRTVTLFTPPVACSTAAVFGAWDELGGPRGEGDNDLEEAALRVAPDLRRYRDSFADATGQRPQLAGSGSTWFVYGAHPGPGHVVAKTVPSGWG